MSLLQAHKNEMARFKTQPKPDNTNVRAIIFNSLVLCLCELLPSWTSKLVCCAPILRSSQLGIGDYPQAPPLYSIRSAKNAPGKSLHQYKCMRVAPAAGRILPAGMGPSVFCRTLWRLKQTRSPWATSHRRIPCFLHPPAGARH